MQLLIHIQAGSGFSTFEIPEQRILYSKYFENLIWFNYNVSSARS